MIASTLLGLFVIIVLPHFSTGTKESNFVQYLIILAGMLFLTIFPNKMKKDKTSMIRKIASDNIVAFEYLFFSQAALVMMKFSEHQFLNLMYGLIGYVLLMFALFSVKTYQSEFVNKFILFSFILISILVAIGTIIT